MPFLPENRKRKHVARFPSAPMNVATDLVHRSLRAEALPEPASNLSAGEFRDHPHYTKFNDNLRLTNRGSAGTRRRTVVESSINGKPGQRRSGCSNTRKETGRRQLSIGHGRRCPGPGVLDEALPTRNRRDMSLNRRRLADRRFASANGEAKPGRYANRQRTDCEHDERSTTPPAPLAVATCSPQHVENLPSDCFQHRGPYPGQASIPG
jgi:hypothetical protein